MQTKTPEFRRPATVQRNGKHGLAKYQSSRSSSTAAADWEVQALSKAVNGLQQRNKHHHHHHHTSAADKKSTTIISSSNNIGTSNIATMKNNGLPALPIPSDVLSTLPSCKISNLRLTSEASPTSESPPPSLASTPTSLDDEQTSFKDSAKPILVNENNNLTSGDGKTSELLSRLILPPTPADSVKDDDEEEESSRDSAELSKQSSPCSLSPILSAPTTIRFPVKAPGKPRGQSTDSGFCRWDKCGHNCETSSALLEHLQVRLAARTRILAFSSAVLFSNNYNPHLD